MHAQQPRETVSAQGIQDGEKQDPSQDTNQRNDFSESKLLHLPIHKKSLKSLT